MGDVVDRSDDLDERIAGSADMETLVHYGHVNRRLIRILGVSLAFDIVLSVMVGYLAWQANEVAQQATSTQARQQAACLSGNEARAGQRQLWHHVLDLPAAAPRTPEQQQQADDLGRYVDDVFQPRKC